MPNSTPPQHARDVAQALRGEIETAYGSDGYLRAAVAMIFSEIERNLAMMHQSGPASGAEIRAKVLVAIDELITLQLGTGRFRQEDGTLSVLGSGLHRLQAIARNACLHPAGSL